MGSDLSKWRHLAVEMVDGACRSDRKRTEIYNISQVMQLQADSSDDSGSYLNLSDVGGNSSSCDVEGSNIPASAEASVNWPATRSWLM